MINCFDEVAIKAKELLKTNTEWRERYKHCTKNLKEVAGNPNENLIDMLSKEFSLINIKPIVNDNGTRFQMLTPLHVDGKTVEYSENGGEIDLICRVNSANKQQLCIMEVRNETTQNDPPKRVIKKAIAYAVFVRELLKSESGSEWYKLFGFEGSIPTKIDMIAATAMPLSSEIGSEFERTEISLGRDDKLVLHSLYFNKDNDKLSIVKNSL